ncbi:replicative DNA helicase [Clostridium sp. MSJ-11]|uniref:Replicative DNA helicase n=1 Tax=Clostridium mobile TaxID=2841512 RepID=A0ABS6EMF6_9CLOT|nr:replicative DNA helicase [Clostridium mobile]MBU5486422.1 replicative DNA helicase [Clostridium mobile]
MFKNIEAEKNILSSILYNNDSLGEVIGILQPNDFQEDSNKIIYQSMKKLYMENKSIDIATLVQEVGTNLKEIGGITYISQLASQGITSANMKAYADIVKENSNLKYLYLNLQDQVKNIEKKKVKAEEVTHNVQEIILKANDTKTSDGDIKEATENVLNILEERFKNGGKVQGIPTGFSKLDMRINGLLKKNFITIAARPSMGKTALALNIANNANKHGKVSIFSLEMSKEELLERMLSLRALVEMDKIKFGNLEDKDWSKIAQESEYIANSNLKIHDDIFGIEKIIAECRKRKLKEGLDVVIIDYLQLIETQVKEGRTQEVSYISRQLKKMSQQLDTTVIALSQLSREPEKRADHRPMLSDLRESGSIEQDSNIVIFLYRDEYYNPETEDKGIVETIIGKNRSGQVGTTKLHWIPEYQRMATISEF